MRRIQAIPGVLHSVYFHIEEFHCRDGTPYPAEWIEPRLIPLVRSLERIREAVEQPILILSGYRTPYYNRKIGGAQHSQHCEGTAVDMRASVGRPHLLYFIVRELIESGAIPDGGLALYPGFVHYDQRGRRARWRGIRTIN